MEASILRAAQDCTVWAMIQPAGQLDAAQGEVHCPALPCLALPALCGSLTESRALVGSFTGAVRVGSSRLERAGPRGLRFPSGLSGTPPAAHVQYSRSTSTYQAHTYTKPLPPACYPALACHTAASQDELRLLGGRAGKDQRDPPRPKVPRRPLYPQRRAEWSRLRRQGRAYTPLLPMALPAGRAESASHPRPAMARMACSEGTQQLISSALATGPLPTCSHHVAHLPSDAVRAVPALFGSQAASVRTCKDAAEIGTPSPPRSACGPDYSSSSERQSSMP